MNQPHYAFTHASKKKTFSFYSLGRQGKIKKVVQFKLIEDEVYNLGFGDYSVKLKSLDDKVVTDNGDMEKVLATVIAITEHFFNGHPNARIFLTGSNTARTRLYQIIINIHFEALIQDYEIFGFLDDEWCLFQKNINYESFLIFKLL